MTNWDERFMMLAKYVASWSKDPSTQVGAVIADKRNRIVSLGFNGFPHGLKDDERLHERSIKYELVIHAEINAIHNANKSVEGCTLYVWPLPPCSRCATQIIQSGIERVVAPAIEGDSRWDNSCNTAALMFIESGVSISDFLLD